MHPADWASFDVQPGSVGDEQWIGHDASSLTTERNRRLGHDTAVGRAPGRVTGCVPRHRRDAVAGPLLCHALRPSPRSGELGGQPLDQAGDEAAEVCFAGMRACGRLVEGGVATDHEHDRADPFEQRVRTALAIIGLARTASLFPEASVDELRTIAVDAALGALQPDDPGDG